jgi:hypothetical protein
LIAIVSGKSLTNVFSGRAGREGELKLVLGVTLRKVRRMFIQRIEGKLCESIWMHAPAVEEPSDLVNVEAPSKKTA